MKIIPDLTNKPIPQTENGAARGAGIDLRQRLGFYQALADGYPLTAFEIAIWTGSETCAVRDWLEEQVEAGLLQIQNPETAVAAHRYCLPTSDGA